MDKFPYRPTTPVYEVTISGAKNAALPIPFAALLAEEPVEIQKRSKTEKTWIRDEAPEPIRRESGNAMDRHTLTPAVNVFCAPYDLL